MTDFTDRIVAMARSERDTFRNGAEKEWMDSVYLRVGDYWNRLAQLPQYASWAGYNGKSDVTFDKKTGKPAKHGNRNQPWSAAFISFLMAEAGAGTAFSCAPAHSVYIVKALREAAKPRSNAAFIARRHRQYAPIPGDLIACERQKQIDPNFDTYISYVAQGRYEAHCDAVVEVSATALVTIGGNVGSSVREKRWPVDKNGMIGNADPGDATATVICVIETRL